MEVIPIAHLQVSPDRQRRDFDTEALETLALSIRDKGLYHPLVVDNEAQTLVAGERRLRAIRDILNHNSWPFQCGGLDIPPGHVPIVRLGQLSALELEEVELEENILREDLSWQERVDAVARLHKLRCTANPDQTQSDTAQELSDGDGMAGHMKVSRAVRLAPFLSDPEIAGAGTQKEAEKLLDKKFERILKERLAEEGGQDSPHTLHCLPAQKGLALLPNSAFDLILTDPPYGIEASGFGSQVQTRHDYEDSTEDWQDLMECLAEEGARVCKSSAHAYVFCDVRKFGQLLSIFEKHEWTVWPTPLIWDKTPMGVAPVPDRGPRRCYEAIMFAARGNRQVLELRTDVLRHGLEGNREHGAQKPVELYVDLAKRSCYPGDTVLDPFCGSGTVFPAANRLGLVATGIEIDKGHYGGALTRMEEKG